MTTHEADGPLTRALVTDTVRLLEGAGPLEYSAALRVAAQRAAEGAGHADQIDARAAVLGQRLGLQAGLARARRAAPWAGLIIAGVVTLSGLLWAGAAIDGQDRRINVLAVLAALLGLHVVSFGLWLLTLAWPVGSGGGASLAGALWLRLTARLALGRGAPAAAALEAGLHLLRRARLLPWVGGLASHLLWLFTLAAALLALLFALSFKRYTLGWETTLLTPDTLARAVHALGVLPGWLGFAVPDAALLQAPEAASPERDRVLAWWLVGCVAVYGLAPRLLAALLCWAVWRTRRSRLRPDLAQPYYRALIARLDALAPAAVVDADTVHYSAPPARGMADAATQPGWAVIGFELPPEQPWPPEPLPAPLLRIERIAGSAAERQALLRELAALRPHTVLLACHAASSPDRGTERFVRELVALCGECRLWLAAAPAADVADDAEPKGAARWRAWLSGLQLPTVRAFADWHAAIAETSNDTTAAPP